MAFNLKRDIKTLVTRFIKITIPENTSADNVRKVQEAMKKVSEEVKRNKD